MKINTVIFDMDGVIIDSEPFWRQAQINELAKFQVIINDNDCIEQTMGKRLDDIARTWCQHYELSIAPADLQQAILQSVVKQILNKGSAKEGVYSLLKFLKNNNINIALATSSSTPIIDAVLERLSIRSFFSSICSADNEKYGKPHPAVYLRTASQLHVQPGQCIVIEDSVTGLIAGVAAGMTTFVVPENINDPRFSIASRSFVSLTEVQMHLT